MVTSKYENPIAQSYRLSDTEEEMNIHVCEHTNVETLYVKDSNGNAICLHNENVADDRWDVAEFRKTLS